MTKAQATIFDLDGKTALVTGGASGIGAGIAALLAEAGATVVIIDVDEAGAGRAAGALREAGRQAGAVPEYPAQRDLLLALLREGRPVLRHRHVQFQLALIDEAQRAERGQDDRGHHFLVLYSGLSGQRSRIGPVSPGKN